MSVFNEGGPAYIDTPEAIEVLDILQKLLVEYKVVSPDTYLFGAGQRGDEHLLAAAGVVRRLSVTSSTGALRQCRGEGRLRGAHQDESLRHQPDTQHAEAAWEFLRFFLSEEGQRIVADDNRAVVLKSVALAPEYVYLDYPPYNLLPFVAGGAVDVVYRIRTSRRDVRKPSVRP